jgi:hypothetical protein
MHFTLTAVDSTGPARHNGNDLEMVFIAAQAMILSVLYLFHASTMDTSCIYLLPCPTVFVFYYNSRNPFFFKSCFTSLVFNMAVYANLWFYFILGIISLSEANRTWGLCYFININLVSKSKVGLKERKYSWKRQRAQDFCSKWEYLGCQPSVL